MSEMTPEVSMVDTLRHIADDHPCCKGSLLAAAAYIEALERKQSELREAGDWLCSYVRGYREESAKLAVRRWEALAKEEPHV